MRLRGRTSPTPRASWTTCARSRAPRWRASCATSSARRRARCRCARPTIASTSRRSRARAAAAAIAARPASPPSSSSRSSSPSCASSLPNNSEHGGTDGVLLVDKPAGVTSHDVVAQVRRRLGKGVKVGHAGTLDPFATGLLLILVGRGTRIQRFLMALPKRYETVARLGYTSTTGDTEGEIVPGTMPGELALPTGLVRQRPPAYSAVKIAGRRAYALARAGEAVEVPEREVVVSRFELAWRDA